MGLRITHGAPPSAGNSGGGHQAGLPTEQCPPGTSRLQASQRHRLQHVLSPSRQRSPGTATPIGRRGRPPDASTGTSSGSGLPAGWPGACQGSQLACGGSSGQRQQWLRPAGGFVPYAPPSGPLIPNKRSPGCCAPPDACVV